MQKFAFDTKICLMHKHNIEQSKKNKKEFLRYGLNSRVNEASY